MCLTVARDGATPAPSDHLGSRPPVCTRSTLCWSRQTRGLGKGGGFSRPLEVVPFWRRRPLMLHLADIRALQIRGTSGFAPVRYRQVGKGSSGVCDSECLWSSAAVQGAAVQGAAVQATGSFIKRDSEGAQPGGGPKVSVRFARSSRTI